MTADGGIETYVAAEQKARMEIDAQLAACGWIVQDAEGVNLSVGVGVAVREFVLKEGHGREDSLLFVEGEGVGAIIEFLPPHADRLPRRRPSRHRCEALQAELSKGEGRGRGLCVRLRPSGLIRV